MWSTYSGYTGVRFIETNQSASESGFFASTSFYGQADPPATISYSTSFFHTEFENYESVRINNGSITYTDSNENQIISALNISAYLQTTTETNQNYELARTSQAEISSTIYTTYTEETTTSTDSPTKTLSITYTYTDLTQITSLVAVNITATTSSGGPEVAVGFSNGEIEAYGNESLGAYMVVHPLIGYPWTSGDESMQFMQTFTYNSNLTGDTNVIKWTLSGTDYGGLLNIDAENKTAYPKTIGQSAETMMYTDYWRLGVYPSSGGTVTALSELTSSISYQSLTYTVTTASIGSRYTYNSSLSQFATLASESSTVSSWYAVSAVNTYVIQQEATLFLSLDPGGENTWSDGNGTNQTYRYYSRTQTRITTGLKTQSYLHVNSGMSGAYFNTFTFGGLAVTTRTIGNAEFAGNNTKINVAFTSTSQIADQFWSSEASYFYERPVQDSVIIRISRGIDVVEVNRIRAFPEYDQPAVTTYILSPNYNFAIGTDSTTLYLDIHHGGYVEKITPESVLTECFWSVYKFERTANINVPVLAYPINTQIIGNESTNSEATTIQSVQIPMEFFNGKAIASIYRTTLSDTTQTIASHTCSYGAIEAYKSMILESLGINDVSSTDVAITAGNIGAGLANFQLGDTLAQSDGGAVYNYLGKTYYPNLAPARRTDDNGGNPHSAIGAQALENQNSFTLVQTTNVGFPFAFTPKPYLVSFSIMQ